MTPSGAEAWGLESAWPMMPWITPWLEFWSAWLGGGGWFPQVLSMEEGNGERRHGVGLPWIPTVETTVVPLRRKTDPPGGTASQISLRVQIPPLVWLGRNNVIALASGRKADDGGGGRRGAPGGAGDKFWS